MFPQPFIRCAGCFNDDVEQYRFGKVNYYRDRSEVRDLNHDFTSGTIPASGNLWKVLLRIGFYKREAYIHEREWRAAIYQDPRDIQGIDIPVDLDGLISEVYVGPAAGAAEFDAVSAVMLNGGLSQRPRRSDLLAPPV